MRKQTLLFILGIALSGIINAADFYWVGGTGNWDEFATHWATTSGGSTFHTAIPTAADNVIFDNKSFSAAGQIVTLNVMGECKNMTWTGVTNTPMFTGFNMLQIEGSIVLTTGMKFVLNSQIQFTSNAAGNTINVKTDSTVISGFMFNGNGEWTMQSDFICPPMMGMIQMQKGTLNTNGQTITVNNMMINAFASPATLTLGNSTLNLGWFNTWGQVTLNAGTSTINLASTNLQGNNLTYYNVNFVPTNPSDVAVQGGNTFNVLSFNKNCNTVRLEDNKTQTLNDLKIASSCGHRVLVTSLGDQPASIKKFSGFVTLDYLNIWNVNILGGATFTANNSNNLGNADGWVINTPASKNFYWVGDNGNWSDPAHWATISGGPSDTSCIPSASDNVFFDNKSFSVAGQSMTIDIPAACKNMNWTGATNTPTFTGSNMLYIGGSLTLINAMTTSYAGIIVFNGSGAGNTITSSNKVLSCQVQFNGKGDWTLQDNLNTTSTLTYNGGTLNTGGRNINCNQFYLTNSSKKSTLNLGASTILTGYWNVPDTSGLKLTPGTSTIRFSSGGTFYGGGLTYNNILVNANSLFVYNSNTFNTITLNAGNTLSLESGSTQTITGITATGTCNNWITLQATTAGTQTNLKATAGSITVSYLKIKDTKVSGGATFTANNSIDQGNNSGWTLNQVAARTLYWIANTGNWSDVNHWSLTPGPGTPGACLPTEVDSVVINDASFTLATQTITINTAASFKSLVWSTTASHTLTANNQTINCYGSFVLNSFTNFTGAQNTIYFRASENWHVINTVNKVINVNCIFNGSGTWKLLDSLRLKTGSWPYYSITFSKGTLNTNNYSIYCQQFDSYTKDTRKLILGSSRINALDTWNMSDSTNLTIVPGTSAIISGTSVFYGGSEAYNYVKLTYNSNLTINGTNTFNNLVIPSSKNIVIQGGTTQTVTTLSIPSGTNCSDYMVLSSSSSGIPATLKKTTGSFTGNWLNLSDVKATGGATFTANNSIGSGDVSGWTFAPVVTGKKMYWVGGSGDWSMPAHWSNTSGGVAAGCLPTANDSVYFDANSFANADTVQINSSVVCKYMDWTGAKFTPRLEGWGTIAIGGTFKLISAMDFAYTGSIKLTGSGTYTINTLGIKLNTLEIACSCDYSLGDSLSLSNNFDLTSGTFRTNNQKVIIAGFGQFNSLGNAVRKLYLGSSQILVPTWSINDSTNYTVDAATSTININGGWTFSGGYRTYNKVIFNPNQFGGSIQFNGSNTFNELVINPGTEISLEPGKVQTTTLLTMSGKSGALINLHSWNAGQQAEFKKTSADFCGDYLAIKDIKGTGVNFYAGGNSQNNGGNTGWSFTAFEAIDQYPAVCENPKGSGSKSGVDLTTLNSAVNGGTANPVAWYNDAAFSSSVTTPTSVTVTDAKIYYAKVTSGGCSASAQARYSVLALPTAKNQVVKLCEDSLASGNVHAVDLTPLKDSITGGATVILSWFSDTACTTPVATPANVVVTNNKKFFAKVDNGSCTSVASVKYIVNGWPTGSNYNPHICEDTPGSGTAAGINLTGFNTFMSPTPGVTIAWYSDTTLATPVVAPASQTVTNNKKYFAKITSTAGCTFQSRLLCTVSGTIQGYNQNAAICETTIGSDTARVNLKLSESAVSGGIPSVCTWFRDSTQTDTIKIATSIKVIKKDTFYVKIVSGSCSGKAKVIYSVNKIPVVTLAKDTTIYTTDSLVIDAGAGFAKYTWSTGDTTRTIKVKGSMGAGTYPFKVTVQSAGGCTASDSITIQIKVKVSLNIDADAILTAYPNPTSGRVNLSVGNCCDTDYLIRVTSITGQLMYDKMVKAGTGANTFVLELGNYPAGVYIISITSDTVQKNVKILLEK